MAEPLLCESSRRMALFPIEHHDLWKRYKQQVECFWTVGEVDLSSDVQHWNHRLSDEERSFVSLVLAFFAVADSIVADNIAERFGREVTWYEVKCFYDFQKSMENVHAEMYSLLIDTYISDSEEKLRLLRAASSFNCVRKKTDWAKKWIGASNSFAERLIAFAVVEGVFFSGSFCAIFWLKSRGLMPGLSHANQLIARDEGMHQQFATYLYAKHVQGKVEEAVVHDIVSSAVQAEVEFCTEACNVRLVGINGEDMVQYIRFVADRLLTELGCSRLYGVVNPFPWMEMICLEGKTNFFESRVSEYKKAGVVASPDRGFQLDANF